MALRGSFAELSVIDVLQLLRLTRKTGVLEASDRFARAVVWLRDGSIVGCRHPSPKVHVGALLLQMEAVSEAVLAEALEEQRRAGQQRQPLVRTLIELGHIDRDVGYEALKHLVELTVREIVCWDQGSFVFDASPVQLADDFQHLPGLIAEQTGMDVQAVLMDALRIVDEKKRAALSRAVSEVLDDAPPAALPCEPEPAAATAAGQPARRLLVVDDDTRVFQAIRRSLAPEGYDVVLSTGGGEIEQLLRGSAFDAALVDYRLATPPDGLEVLRWLRRAQPGCLRFLMSGHLDLHVVLAAVNDVGVHRVIEKPFVAGALLESLDEALSPARPTRAPSPAGGHDRAALSRQLSHCIEQDMLLLALQPIVDASTLDIFAFEALLRSGHEQMGSVAQVLSAAECLGRIDDVADVVAKKAAEWLEHFPQRFKLFVNIHPREFANPSRLRQRAALLAGWRERVVLELTERERMPERKVLDESLRVLRDHGFGLALDDLGAGYSSLSTLADIGMNFVKIDRALVRGLHGDPQRQELVASIIRGSKAVGARVIAEGVEQPEEAEVLRRCGADFLQGYLFGRPSPTPRITLHAGRFRFAGAAAPSVADAKR